MKILHSADWHLGAYVGPQCDDPMKRMENTMRCLDRLVETARAEQPDIILIAGDIFHTAKVWAERALTEVQIAADYLNELSEIAPVTVLYGTPNHDGPGQFGALIALTNDNVTFFVLPEMSIIQTKSGPIQIAGLPGFDKGHFRAQFPGLSAEEENQVFTQQLASVVQGLSAQVNSTIPSVLMAHHTVVGCELDNGTHVFQANEVVLDTNTLDNSAFDLVCLGHIHKAQRVMACSKPVYYAGSIDANTFNDEGHEKGFWITQLNHGGITNFYEFIKTPAREFHTLLGNQEIISNYIAGKNFFCDCGIGGEVVRVLYTCDSETEKALDKKKLERDLYAAGAYYVSEIRPEKVTAAVNRDRMTEKLTVGDCLNRYLNEKKITPDSILKEYALEIIEEAQASSPIGTTSGLFLPVEIEVRNYRSYAEEKLSFEDIFFAMVNGKNGSGKSSLFMDAITDCLYEETREKELTGWIRNGEKSGSISFTFKLGDDLWRVTRTRQRSGKATLALAKLTGGYEEDGIPIGMIYQDHSCERFTDTQQKIKDLLGMDCDTFQSCVLIMQDRYGKFMEASKEDRMNVLASLLDLGIYDELEKLAKEKLTDVNRTIKVLKTDIEKLESDVAFEDDLYTEKAQVETSLAVSTQDLQAARTELAGYQAQLAAMDGYVREAGELERELKVKTDSYSEKKNRKADLENRVFETETFLQGEQNILDRCAELDRARLDIAALDGKVAMLEDKNVQCGKANLEFSFAQLKRKEIAISLATIKKRLEDKERLEKVVNENTIEADLEECEKKAAEYRELKRLEIEADTSTRTYDRETERALSSFGDKLKWLESQTAMLKDSNCIDSVNAKCKFLKSARDAQDGIKNINEQLEAYRPEREKGIESLVDAADKISVEIVNLQYDGDFHNALIQEAKTFRVAKDRLSKMAADSATADALVGQDAELILKITNCDQELKLLSVEIAALEQETSKHAELKVRVNSLLRFEEQKMQLPKAKQFVESTGDAIKQLGSDLAELVLAIGKASDRIAELQRLTDNREVLRQSIRDNELTIKVIESDISTLNQQIGNINAKLEVISTQRAQLTAKQAELSTAAKQAAQLQILSEAFSQDGIPYQIIRDIVPELEAAANEILGQMTGGRMRLEFVTEKVLKSNKAKEIATLEIIIIDVDNGTLPYLSRSGGQKVRCALANSFALAMIKASRVGLQLGMLFVDEPVFLDADGIEGYCNALETIHNKYPEMRILAISHDEDMKNRFPQQLYVEMTENGSRVRRL